jgi:hypothetical protein
MGLANLFEILSIHCVSPVTMFVLSKHARSLAIARGQIALLGTAWRSFAACRACSGTNDVASGCDGAGSQQPERSEGETFLGGAPTSPPSQRGIGRAKLFAPVALTFRRLIFSNRITASLKLT